MTVAVLLAGLAACGVQYTRDGGVPLTQSSVLRALTAVKATEEQRAKVLGAFETARPRLEELHDEAESLRDQIYDLSPRSDDYLAQADKRAARLGEIASDQTRLRSRFVHDVANTLDERQWDRWLSFFRGPFEEDLDARRYQQQQQPDQRRGP